MSYASTLPIHTGGNGEHVILSLASQGIAERDRGGGSTSYYLGVPSVAERDESINHVISQ